MNKITLYIPSQLEPSSITNPPLQRQLYDPSVFMHSGLATVTHWLTCAAHSSTSDMRECDMNVIFIHRCKTHILVPVQFASKWQGRVKQAYSVSGMRPRSNGFSIRSLNGIEPSSIFVQQLSTCWTAYFNVQHHMIHCSTFVEQQLQHLLLIKCWTMYHWLKVCYTQTWNKPAQFCPSPVYPSLQEQLYPPLVLLQLAFTWHLWEPL